MVRKVGGWWGRWESSGEGGRVAGEGSGMVVREEGRMDFNYRMCDLIVFMANPLQIFPTCSV